MFLAVLFCRFGSISGNVFNWNSIPATQVINRQFSLRKLAVLTVYTLLAVQLCDLVEFQPLHVAVKIPVDKAGIEDIDHVQLRDS